MNGLDLPSRRPSVHRTKNVVIIMQGIVLFHRAENMVTLMILYQLRIVHRAESMVTIM